MMDCNSEWNQFYLEHSGTFSLDSPELLADGYYYSTGVAEQSLAVLKHDQKGLPVSEFGTQGMSEIAWPGEEGSWPDITLIGKHLYGGAALRGSQHFVLYRLDSTTGALDLSFGNKGLKIIPYPDEPGIPADQYGDTGKVAYLYEKPGSKPFSLEMQGRAPQVPDNKFRQAVNSGLAQFDSSGELDRSYNEVGMRRFFIRNGRLHFTLRLAARHENGQHTGFYYGGSYRYLGDDVEAWVGAVDQEGRVVAEFADNGVWIVSRLPGLPDIAHVSTHAILQTRNHLYCGGTVGDDAFVLRLNLDGSVDSTFNNGNAVRFEGEFGEERTRTFDLAEDGDGVLVGLRPQTGASVTRFLVRLDGAGQIDGQFAQEGYLMFPENWPVDKLLVREIGGLRTLEICAPGYIARYTLAPNRSM